MILLCVITTKWEVGAFNRATKQDSGLGAVSLRGWHSAGREGWVGVGQLKREMMRALGRESHIFKDPLGLHRMGGGGWSLKQGYICTDSRTLGPLQDPLLPYPSHVLSPWSRKEVKLFKELKNEAQLGRDIMREGERFKMSLKKWGGVKILDFNLTAKGSHWRLLSREENIYLLNETI